MTQTENNKFGINLNDYQTDILKNDIVNFLYDIRKKGGDNKFNLCTIHVVSAKLLIEKINEALAKEGKPPNETGFINPETQTVLMNCRWLSSYIDFLEFSPKIRSPINVLINLKLLVYLQVIETKYVYKVIGNSLNVLLGINPEGDLFDNLPPNKNCYDEVMIMYKKVLDIASTGYKLFDKWIKMFDRNLRNAIAHNDYVIDKDSNQILIPSNLTKALNNPGKKIKTIAYSFEYINILYKCVSNFNEAFRNVLDDWEDNVQKNKK